jgi:hypothetical protein
MRLGLARKKRFLVRALALMATGGTVLSVVGCEGEMAGVFVDAMKSALQTAVPAIMDIIKADVVNDGTDNTGGTGANGFLPTVMRDRVDTVDATLA